MNNLFEIGNMKKTVEQIRMKTVIRIGQIALVECWFQGGIQRNTMCYGIKSVGIRGCLYVDRYPTYTLGRVLRLSVAYYSSVGQW